MAEAVMMMSVEAARTMEVASDMAVAAIGGGRGRSSGQRERYHERESKGPHPCFLRH